jgi:hypothetical protein
MESAPSSSIRISAQLREAAERVLRAGESLSQFAEESLRTEIARRAAKDGTTRTTRTSYKAESVLAELTQRLESRRAAGTRSIRPK